MNPPPDDSRGGLGTGPATPRALLWVQLAGVALFALVSVAMTVLGAAILLTGGAAVDQDGAGWGEAGWTVVFAALAVALARTALHLRRQLRA